MHNRLPCVAPPRRPLLSTSQPCKGCASCLMSCAAAIADLKTSQPLHPHAKADLLQFQFSSYCAAGQRLQTLRGHQSAITCLQFSKQTSLLLSGSVDRTAVVWQADTGMQMQRITVHSGVFWSTFGRPICPTYPVLNIRLKMAHDFVSWQILCDCYIMSCQMHGKRFHPEGTENMGCKALHCRLQPCLLCLRSVLSVLKQCLSCL